LQGKASLNAQVDPSQSKIWNEIIADLPQAHVLQTWQWSQVKAAYGWQPLFALWAASDSGRVDFQIAENPEDLVVKAGGSTGQVRAACLVLQRNVSFGGLAARLRIIYTPKGPLLDWEDAPLRRQVLDDLRRLARRQGAIFIKIDPDVALGSGVPGEPGSKDTALGRAVLADLADRGWVTGEQIQFRNTVLIDLDGDEDGLLGRMKQKTRYNIRLAERKGVRVRAAGRQDFPFLYRMYAETSLRDGFVIRPQEYYECVWSTFLQSDMVMPLIAELDGEILAAVMIFHFGGRAWYLYGMSRDLHREKMPNYLLQWEAMRRARLAGCQVYDFWGAPESFDESDPLWGVFRFKEGFGGQVARYLGAWDLPVNLWMYRLYTQVLPRILNILRRRGKAETRRQME
jgi:lipid II:glycine glycyltransferase (peptidoglycan interpeptide bridge formation enzyme)